MKQIQMYIDTETKEKIIKVAEASDISISQLLRKLISQEYDYRSFKILETEYGSLREHFIFRVTDEQKNKIEKETREINVTISDLLRYLIKDYLKNYFYKINIEIQSEFIEPKLSLLITEDYKANKCSTLIRIMAIGADFDIKIRKKILRRLNELKFHWDYFDKLANYNKNQKFYIYIWDEEFEKASKVIEEFRNAI